MKMDGSQSEIVINENCNQPIILDNRIYYLDGNGNICLYLLDKQQNTILYNCKADHFNLNPQYVFYSSENGIFRMDPDGKNLKQIYNGHAGILNVIGEYIFFDAGDGYSKIKGDGSEYNEYFEFF